jgi:Chaperone of endosialidase
MKTLVPTLLIIFSLTCFAFLSKSQAVVPPPDGGYPGGNTAEGYLALNSLNTSAGLYNTAVGVYSLLSIADGAFCTGVGAGSLFANTAAENTATGAGALFSHTDGGGNTAIGAFALFSHTSGIDNTVVGDRALLISTTGGFNTAIGQAAMLNNDSGSNNVAIGVQALGNNSSGSNNIVLGNVAGTGVTTANDVICIGAGGENVDSSCYIGGIFNATSSGGTAVFINSSGKLGTSTSSQRFKEEIKPMKQASEVLFALKPVSFHYKKEIDPQGTKQFGLVAEDVEKVSPDLVVRDKEGKPYTVRYDQVNAMLLNEFLKEHRKVEELETIVALQQKSFQSKVAEQRQQIDALALAVQKIGAQVDMNTAASKVVARNQ